MFYRYILPKNSGKHHKSIKTFQEKWNLKPHHFKLKLEKNNYILPTISFTNKKNTYFPDTKNLGSLVNGLNLSKYSKLIDTTKINKLKNFNITNTIFSTAVITELIRKSTVVSESIAKQSTSESVAKQSTDLADSIVKPSIDTPDYIGKSSTVISDSTDLSTVHSDFIALDSIPESSTVVSDPADLSTVHSDFIAEPSTVVSDSISESSTVVSDSISESSTIESDSIAESSKIASDSITEPISISASTTEILESMASASKPFIESLGLDDWVVKKSVEYLPTLDMSGTSFIYGFILKKIIIPKAIDIIKNIISRYRSNRNM